MATKTKKAALRGFDKFMEEFEKSYGAGTLRDGDDYDPYVVTSTGSLALDDALRVGGLVEGRLNEFWGPDAVGKSTLALLCLAEFQRKYPDKRVAWIDMEQVFDQPWAESHGVNLKMLKVFTPSSAEDVADALKDIVRSGFFAAVVLDSIGAMIPEAEKEKDADKAVMAQQAKIVTRMVKIAAVEANKTKTTVILLNQVRANLGYGADTTTGGGFALKHVTTVKLKLSRTSTDPFYDTIDGEKEIVGYEIRIKVERNKVAAPNRTATMVLFNQPSKYGPIGLDKVDEAATMGIKRGVIGQRGAWYDTPDGESYNGRAALLDGLRANPALIETVRKQVLAIASGDVVQAEYDPETDLANVPEDEA